jgi:hypothetical protein
MTDETNEFYYYISNGVKVFTSNIDLAHKRADEGSEIEIA